MELKSPHHIMITNVHCGYFHRKIYYPFSESFSWVFVSKHMDTSKTDTKTDFQLNQLLRITFTNGLLLFSAPSSFLTYTPPLPRSRSFPRKLMWWCWKRKYAHSSALGVVLIFLFRCRHL